MGTHRFTDRDRKSQRRRSIRLSENNPRTYCPRPPKRWSTRAPAVEFQTVKRLTAWGSRTAYGQKRFMTTARLCQLRKRSPQKWDYAFDSYYRPRRRIRKLVNEALTEIQNQRKHRRRRIWLSNKTILDALLHGITWSDLRSLVVGPKHLHDQILKQGGKDGCRGPPALIRHALKVAKNVMFSLTRMCWQPTVQRGN